MKRSESETLRAFVLGFLLACLVCVVSIAVVMKNRKPHMLAVQVEQLHKGKWREVYWGQEIPYVTNAETQRTFEFGHKQYRIRFE